MSALVDEVRDVLSRHTEAEPALVRLLTACLDAAEDFQARPFRLVGTRQSAPPPPAKAFLNWFQAEYQSRRHGAAYFVVWSKHMPIVGRLLKLHAPDRLRKHAQILLTTDEPWTETTDRGIEVLAGKINWLEERLAAWETKQRAREAV